MYKCKVDRMRMDETEWTQYLKEENYLPAHL